MKWDFRFCNRKKIHLSLVITCLPPHWYRHCLFRRKAKTPKKKKTHANRSKSTLYIACVKIFRIKCFIDTIHSINKCIMMFVCSTSRNEKAYTAPDEGIYIYNVSECRSKTETICLLLIQSSGNHMPRGTHTHRHLVDLKCYRVYRRCRRRHRRAQSKWVKVILI